MKPCCETPEGWIDTFFLYISTHFLFIIYLSTHFCILTDAEQKAHFLYMTRKCHSPDAFGSTSEPEVYDEETCVGYAADSEDDGWDGDISEDEMGVDPNADEDFFGDDEMEDNPTDEEGVLDNGVEGEEESEMEADGSSGTEGDDSSNDGTTDDSTDDEGEEESEMEADGASGTEDVDSCDDGTEDDSTDGEHFANNGVEGEEESEMEVDGVWGCVSDAESDDGDEDDGDADCVGNGVEEEDGDSDDQIIRPVRHLRNVVGSDDDGGEVTTRATHPPGTMAVFDEIAPEDINSPCEFQIRAL